MWAGKIYPKSQDYFFYCATHCNRSLSTFSGYRDYTMYFDFSENGLLMITNIDDTNVRYCTNSSQCKQFLRTEFGFCNFDHNISGFCERCDTILESCSGQGFLCESGLKECFLNCEGIQIC